MATPKKPNKPARKAAKPPVINLKATEVKSSGDRSAKPAAKKPEPKKAAAKKPEPAKQTAAKPSKPDAKPADKNPMGAKPPQKTKSKLGRNAVFAAIALLVAGGGYLVMQNPALFSPTAKQAQNPDQAATIAALKARIDALETAAKDNSALNAAQKDASAVAKRIGELDAKLAETQKSLGALKTAIESATANGDEGPDRAIAANKLRLDGLDAALKDTGTAIDKVRTDLASAATKQADAQSRAVADLKTQLEQINKAQAELRTAIDTLKGDMKTMAAAPRVGPTDRLARGFTVLRAKAMSGKPFVTELDDVAKVLPGEPVLDTLRAHAETGIKTMPQLTAALNALKPKTASAETPSKADGLFGQVKQKFSGLVKVRKVGEIDVGKHLATAKGALATADLAGALATLAKVDSSALPGLDDWRKDAKAHFDSAKALNTLTGLVASRVASAKQ